MSRLGEHAFRCSEVRAEDEQLSRRMKLLGFLTPEALEIKPELFNETLLAIAADELRKINAFKTPGEKVQCVVSVIVNINIVLAVYYSDGCFSFCRAFSMTGQISGGYLPITESVPGKE